MDIKALIALPFNLPSLPRVMALLLFELERPELNLLRITQLVSSDPCLTARLMTVANAPYFQLSGQVRSVSESLALLGIGQVRSMAAEAVASSSFKVAPGLNLQQFSTYSHNVGKVARSLAGVLRLNQQAAFTCGLVHAMGELALLQLQPAEMAEVSTDATPLNLRRAEFEMRHFGYCYAHVGATMAQRWAYPQDMVDALEHQCDPFANDVYEPLAGVLHLATWRARAKEANLDQRGMAVTFPGEVGDMLKLDIDMVLQQDPIDWFSARSAKAS